MWTDFIPYLRALAARVTTSENGQTLVEYALIVALVSVALVAGLQALTGNIGGVFTSIGNTLKGA